MKTIKPSLLLGASIITAGLAANAQTFLTNGLVAYYPFDGNANDATGHGHNGINNGALLTTDRFGNPSAAYDFDGTTSYIDLPQDSTLNSLTQDITVSAWMWQRASGTNGYRLVDKETAGEGDGWSLDTLNCTAQTGHRLRLQGAANNSCNVNGQTDYSLMQWHHVVFTVSGMSGSLYLDGILNGSGNVGTITGNTLDIYIGMAHPGRGTGFYFDGAVDDVRIYSRALPDAEVQQLYVLESGPRVNLLKKVQPNFSGLSLGTNYQLQVSTDMNNWTNSGSLFTATNMSMLYPQEWYVDQWGKLFFRIQVAP